MRPPPLAAARFSPERSQVGGAVGAMVGVIVMVAVGVVVAVRVAVGLLVGVGVFGVWKSKSSVTAVSGTAVMRFVCGAKPSGLAVTSQVLASAVAPIGTSVRR